VSENTVTSNDATKKNPSQGKFKSGFKNNKGTLRIDTNKHGIRRETNLQPGKKTGRKKV
jgi:hypothetical protein